MEYEKYIYDFIHLNGETVLFKNAKEKTAFIVLANAACGLVGGSESVSGNVSGEYDCDYLGLVSDTYSNIFIPIVRGH